MQAEETIVTEMPEAFESVYVDTKVRFTNYESLIAYLNLIHKRAKKYFKKHVEENEILREANRHELGFLAGEIYSNKENLEKERKDNSPLGFRFTNEVIEIELNFYDTVEEQIKYLKEKIELFKNLVSNTSNPAFDEVEEELLDILCKKEELLGNGRTFRAEGKISDIKELKKFGRGELKIEVDKIAKELKLEKYVSVPAKKVLFITNRLIKEGWDTKKASVATTLRKLNYVETASSKK